MSVPHYFDERVTLHHGDCLDVLRTLPDASVDSVVTDPPYNLSFMAKPWDAYEGREDAGFAYWLSGLIDGEGCFTIKAHARGTHAPMFRLKLRADDGGIVRRIHKSMGVGTITEHKAREGSAPQVSWDVQDKAGCQRLVDLLDKYPLRAKKAVDYWTWREAVCEWTSRPRGNRWHGQADNTRMAELRDRLMENRAYADVPWSGHEFQDWCRLWATECLRVLKPGGHLLAFGGTRTWHRLACAVEDAGFEIRDSIAWLYGSGFPKSLDVSKAIDKRAEVNTETKRRIALVGEVIRTHREAKGMERAAVSLAVVGTPSGACWNWEHQQLPSAEMWPAIKRTLDIPDDFDGLIEGDRAQFIAAERAVLATRLGTRLAVAPGQGEDRSARDLHDTAPATPAAEQWQGWGTALKPAFEPVVVARKPLSGTVAANVLEHGTGALNIDGCRIGGDDCDGGHHLNCASSRQGEASANRRYTERGGANFAPLPGVRGGSPAGRWPANVVLDESQAEALDEMSGTLQSGANPTRRGSDKFREAYGDFKGQEDCTPARGADSGGASRFFYVAKAPATERPRVNGTAHPTVKPLDLMRWLVRLVTPPGGTVLEPFAGSGTTVEACIVEGFRCIAIEKGEEYLPLITQRIHRQRNPVEAIRQTGADLGLFELDGEGA